MDLVEAARRGDLRLVKELCDDANVDFRDEHGESALSWAVCRDDLTMVKYLCERGADVNIVFNYGLSLLQYALECRDEEIFKELCKRGAKPCHTIFALPHLQIILLRQGFRRNILVLVGHIQIDLLRVVHGWWRGI